MDATRKSRPPATGTNQILRMEIIKEIPFIQTYKEFNQLMRERIKEIDEQIQQLERERLQLTRVISRNVESITDLEGYECVLSSTDGHSMTGKGTRLCVPEKEPAGNEVSIDKPSKTSKKEKHLIHKNERTRKTPSKRNKYYTTSPYTLK